MPSTDTFGIGFNMQPQGILSQITRKETEETDAHTCLSLQWPLIPNPN